ncbi:MAG TPA: tRNA (adenosine(37)-N6)-threonylcarbamoyltransferase complex dimerization subunit type 1 TsaB [Gemmatimonadales bacterium]|jgi:tRNA threonylcarbamoyladenosine biosynthesis protein TsaB|nr:tRNA (adenosine(37)-N6)-threonylcarbamoyltransferase complex dimerization subunit type 1 TsaB [Gemmatimonadales bacterium]
MLALALETTTDRLSVAGRSERSDGRTVECVVEGARQHAGKLFPLIDEVLRELGGRLDDVASLAVADGPGSFTGLRVGFAAAKALARVRPELTVWTASTLLVRAAGVAPPPGARVLVVTSALRGELYAALYRLELPRAVETLFAPALATPESLHRETPDLLVADAPEKLVDRLADQFAVPLVRGAASRPNAAALLALRELPGGAWRVRDLAAWEPNYGRPAEAQARWEALHGRALPDSSRVAG